MIWPIVFSCFLSDTTRDFLNMKQYKNANRWADMLLERPQVQRGMVVCRKTGKPWLDVDRFKHLASL